MKKYLIGHLARFGDCLYATAIAKQIKYDYPASHITWAVASAFKSILENNPYIDDIWEVKITDGDYYGKNWMQLEHEANQMKKMGIFDEVIFSQIAPNNCHNFTGTIRHSTLQNFNKKISVSVEPVVSLTIKEVLEVRNFIESKSIHKYEHIVLFECAPNSKQSKLEINIALSIANEIIKNRNDVAIIISSSISFQSNSSQIIDGSELPFKHNAELTKYCKLFVGCSSGLTWLATSDWAKKLPMIQILDRESLFFAGVAYDFQLNNFDDKHIIEIVTFSEKRVIECIILALDGDFSKAREKFHEEYKVSYLNFKAINKALTEKQRYLDGFRQVFKFKKIHKHLLVSRLIICYLFNCLISLKKIRLF